MRKKSKQTNESKSTSKERESKKKKTTFFVEKKEFPRAGAGKKRTSFLLSFTKIGTNEKESGKKN